MLNKKNTFRPPNADIWFISAAQCAEVDSVVGHSDSRTKTVMTYKISEIAYYMLNPGSVQIKNKLVGYSIHYPSPRSWYKEVFKKFLPNTFNKIFKDRTRLPEMVTSELETEQSRITDENMRLHISDIYDQLKPYDIVIKTLSSLDDQTVSDLEGVCRDEAGNFSNITLYGTLEEKAAYVKENLWQKVPVSLKKAHMVDGLFEMSGFDFMTYRPETVYELIRSRENGKNRAYVLSTDQTNNQKVQFHVENIKLVYYLQLLEQLIKINPELMEAFSMCVAGKAKPLKLFFKRQLGIDYSPEQIPEIYQEVFEKHHIGVNKKEIVANALRDRQLGISFIYVSQTFLGKNRQETNLSILHNFRALESIKEEVPQVFSEIDNIATITEVGKFYLLDTYKGYKE